MWHQAQSAAGEPAGWLKWAWSTGTPGAGHQGGLASSHTCPQGQMGGVLKKLGHSVLSGLSCGVWRTACVEIASKNGRRAAACISELTKPNQSIFFTVTTYLLLACSKCWLQGAVLGASGQISSRGACSQAHRGLLLWHTRCQAPGRSGK